MRADAAGRRRVRRPLLHRGGGRGRSADALQPDAVVINKSTVPVGSTQVVERVLGRTDVHVVSNPEFLREGSAVHDFLNPDRIVIGADDQSAAVRVASLYLGIAAPPIVTDPASAETIKYAANAFLATKISFVNAIAAVCEAVGADINDVVLGMGYDRRIGAEFLRPGPGWGGSCFVGDETAPRPAARADPARCGSTSSSPRSSSVGADGWEALSWRPGEADAGVPPGQPLHRAALSTATSSTIRTKMGRRLTVTADHPFVVGDGTPTVPSRRLAGELTTDDWLPVAQGFPLVLDDPRTPASAGSSTRCEPAGSRRRAGHRPARRSAAARCSRSRSPSCRASPARRGPLAERCGSPSCGALRIPTLRGRFGTTTNGTYVPDVLPFDERFWRMIGLWLAEGHIAADGGRRRLTWSLRTRPARRPRRRSSPSYWRGVRCEGRRSAGWRRPVACRSRRGSSRPGSSTSSGPGRTAYDKRIPDAIWAASDADKKALLRGSGTATARGRT